MNKTRLIIIGCGDRASIYTKQAIETRGDVIEIVAVIDPNDVRLKYMQDTFGIGADKCYHDVQEVLSQGKIGDCVINCTMDSLHVSTTIPFLKQGYDVLLEKPAGNNIDDVRLLKDTATMYGRKLVICHVLRYAPIYRLIKDVIDQGKIGEIMHIESEERVGIAHASLSFIRGKHSNQQKCGSGMLLSKCCHDIDLACWLNNKTTPVSVASMGGRDFLNEAHAPIGSGERCMVDCPYNDSCRYSAENLYIKHENWPQLAFQTTGKLIDDLSIDDRKQSLKTDNPQGVCAYKSGADVVDHQTMIAKFGNGSTFVHSMTQGSPRAGRRLYILGTEGEIESWTESNTFVLRTYDYTSDNYIEKTYDVQVDGGHFGGDKVMIQDFIDTVRGTTPSVSCAYIETSIYGYECVFEAEESRLHNGIAYEIK